MPFITRLPALTGADPYPDALLALDFVGARRGPQYYKALGITTSDITKVPGWTYTGGTAAGVGSYAARQDGSLQFFPSYTNLLLQSQTFDNGSWLLSSATVTANATTAPDGTATADKIVEAAATAAHGISQIVTKSAVSATYTASTYLKADTRTRAVMWINGSTSANRVEVAFNLSTGAILTAAATVGTFTSASATITPAANGYYFVTLTGTTNTDTAIQVRVFALDNTASASSPSYTGDGTSGIYIWGAQLELGSTASTYIPTTTAAVTVGTPRITDAGYWAEEARTNLLLNSATLSTQSVTVTAVAHTLSFYGTGTVTLTGVSTAGPLVGTGASNRVSLTFTPTAGTLTLTVSGSVTIAQLEAGSFATSPIPTTSVAVTRAADVGYVSGIAIPTTGTMVATANVPATAADKWWAYASDGTINNRISIGADAGTSQAGSVIAVAGTPITNTVTGNVTGAVKTIALAYAPGAQALTSAGTTPATGSVASIPTVTRFDVGGGGSAASTRQANGPIRRIVIYPRAFGNAELQAITTAGAY